MNFKIKTLRFNDGEEITVRETEDGNHVCPVCGSIGPGDAPYDNWWTLVNGQRVGPAFAAGSFNICPDCHTQYGDSDFPHIDEPQSVNWKWRQLRGRWLRSVEITEKIKEQLRNLDLNPEEEIRHAHDNESLK